MPGKKLCGSVCCDLNDLAGVSCSRFGHRSVARFGFIDRVVERHGDEFGILSCWQKGCHRFDGHHWQRIVYIRELNRAEQERAGEGDTVVERIRTISSAKMESRRVWNGWSRSGRSLHSLHGFKTEPGRRPLTKLMPRAERGLEARELAQVCSGASV